MLRPYLFQLQHFYRKTASSEFTVDLVCVLVVLFFLYGLEDFFIDVCAWFVKAKPKELSPRGLEGARTLSE